jgi:hypothetical protein
VKTLGVAIEHRDEDAFRLQESQSL